MNRVKMDMSLKFLACSVFNCWHVAIMRLFCSPTVVQHVCNMRRQSSKCWIPIRSKDRQGAMTLIRLPADRTGRRHVHIRRYPDVGV